MFKKIIDSLLGKKKHRSYSSSDYRQRGRSIQVATINDVHLVMGISIIKKT